MYYTLFKDCVTGKPCGEACISKKRLCRDEIQGPDAARVDAFVARVIQQRKGVSAKAQSDNAVSALTSAETFEQKAAIVIPLMTTLSPEEAKAILEADREGGPLMNRQFKDGEYFLPEMKRREVSDLEVDAAWDSLTTAQRNILFPRKAGAPDRDKSVGDRIEIDWNKNTDRMRRSMLKAMLEQSTEDGRVIDPWTNEELKFPADLDHIVPLAKGGTHGSALTTDDTAPYDGSNWVWTNKHINRNYKGDNDLNGTIAGLKEALDPEGYKEAVNETVRRYEGEKIRSMELRKITSEGSIPHPSVIDTITKKSEIESLMKGLSDHGYIERSQVTKDAETAKGILEDLDRQLPAAVDRLIAARKPMAQVHIPDSIAQIVNEHTSAEGLLDFSGISDTDLNDFTDTFLQSRSRDQVPPKIAAEIDSMKLLKSGKKSNSGWTSDGQVPDIRKASLPLRQYIHDIGFNGNRTIPSNLLTNGSVLRRTRS